MANPLEQLRARGQSIWLDFISRHLVVSGELERLLAADGITGLTSNPTIFEKAIAEGSDYDAHIRQLLQAGIVGPEEIFLGVAISDIQRAADILRPVHDRTGGNDGFVSLEVSPAVAGDTEATVAMAASLWTRVARPNLMVKIPATPAGIPAIEATLAAGINVNVTLIFALTAYQAVINAYLNALETRHRRGEPLTVRSVASFFVSRVDTAVDKLLDARLAIDPGNPRLESLLGKAAIANAVLAYEAFELSFEHGRRFAPLRAAGAAVQRPLWASTSAKNPNYRDVVYAEALIGKDTVDTMPPDTISAFRDHGIVAGDTVKADYPGAHRTLDQLKDVGVSIEEVTEGLLKAGVGSFAASYNQLIRVIAEQVDGINGGLARRQVLDLGDSAGPVTEALSAPAATRVVERIWRRDPDLWKPGDQGHAEVITNRLGWLDLPITMGAHVPRLLALSEAMRVEEIRDAVLLGMGGSSLCPEVLRTSLGSAAVHPRLQVLDTTDPAVIRTVTAGLDPHRTIFIVASKSGTTIETLSQFAHFWEFVGAGGVATPGGQFIAITDPGTPLAALAAEHGFRETFVNPADIGGRYSALSFFGLVPAAIMGLDVEALLDRASAMRAQCAPGNPAELNCGLVLGTALGVLHGQGRDKVTLLTSPRLGAFALWVEQLIAESTGKEGRGIIPIGQEPVALPAAYGDDRVFVALAVGDDPGFERQIAPLRAAGLPVITLTLDDTYDLGAEFFRWEFATAVAAVSLAIDPFDEPNVQESKDNTRRELSRVEGGALPPGEEPSARRGDLSAFGATAAESPEDALETLLSSVAEGDYFALLAWTAPADAVVHVLEELRIKIRDRHRIATTLGFGPRFLHSTGQLHKGGPNSGIYLQLTAAGGDDVPIPGRPYGFSVLEEAQARGDLEALRAHGRRVLRLHISGDVETGISRLTAALGHPAGAPR